jgi:hypothetical protein
MDDYFPVIFENPVFQFRDFLEIGIEKEVKPWLKNGILMELTSRLVIVMLVAPAFS